MNSILKIPYVILISLLSLYSTIVQAQCESGGHSTHPDDNWLSCATSTNAADRTGHWIQYDFGTTYQLLTSHFWNYNVVGEVDRGFKDVQINYSLDGTNWESFGTFTFAAATAGNDYAGEAGPDFGGIEARYLLLTALNNHAADACSGLGELKVNIKNCSQLKSGITTEAVTCNNGGAIQIIPEGGLAPFTIQWADAGSESYRSNLTPGTYALTLTDNRGCSIQQNITIPNATANTTRHPLSAMPIPTDTFERAGIIESAGIVTGRSKVGFRATNSIELLPGFQANVGCDFLAAIIPCVPEAAVQAAPIHERKAKLPNKAIAISDESSLVQLSISPNPFVDNTSIEIKVEQEQLLTIAVHTLLGQPINILVDKKLLSAGTHSFNLSLGHLPSGLYLVKVYNASFGISRKVILLK